MSRATWADLISSGRGARASLLGLMLKENYPSRIFSTIAEVEQSSRKSNDFTSPP